MTPELDWPSSILPPQNRKNLRRVSPNDRGPPGCTRGSPALPPAHRQPCHPRIRHPPSKPLRLRCQTHASVPKLQSGESRRSAPSPASTETFSSRSPRRGRRLAHTRVARHSSLTGFNQGGKQLPASQSTTILVAELKCVKRCVVLCCSLV